MEVESHDIESRMKTETIQTLCLPWLNRRYHWQVRHYWAILKLRRAVVLWTATACLGAYAAWLAALSYKASVFVKVHGLCPHGLVVGDTQMGIVGQGSAAPFYFKVKCSLCERTNEKETQD
jgi:hypothetical protein